MAGETEITKNDSAGAFDEMPVQSIYDVKYQKRIKYEIKHKRL